MYEDTIDLNKSCVLRQQDMCRERHEQAAISMSPIDSFGTIILAERFKTRFIAESFDLGFIISPSLCTYLRSKKISIML